MGQRLQSFEMPLHVFALNNACLRFAPSTRQDTTNPKVNLQIPRTTKFPVSNLESDCHLIIPLQDLVEAFSLMGAHLDVVRDGGGEEAQEGGKEWEAHCGR